MKVYNKLRLVLYRIQLKSIKKEAPKSIFESAVYPLKHKDYVNTRRESILGMKVYDRKDTYTEERNTSMEKNRQKIKKIEDKIDKLK